MTSAVGLWHLEHRRSFKVLKATKRYQWYNCIHSGRCPFELRASFRENFWIVYQFKPEHTCELDFGQLRPRKVNYKTIAAYFAKKMRREGTMIKPRNMMNELLQNFGIRSTYDKALRARKKAMEMIYGSHAASFNMLPRYLNMLKLCNLGTVTHLETDPDGRFEYVFVAFGPCISAFMYNLRPVIVVDGTHLKGSSKGILFIAVAKDGNEQCLPLAIGIGPIENDDSWTWFLSRLRGAFGTHSELLIVSDQHISIKNVIDEVYPNNAHGLCFYHLLNKLTPWGGAIVTMFRKAAYTYREVVYEKAMESIRLLSPDGAYRKLLDVVPERWARSKCPVRRYSFLTSNAAESFNGRLLWARHLPVCSLIDTVRHIIEK